MMRSKLKFVLRCLAYVFFVPYFLIMLPVIVIGVFMWAEEEDSDVGLFQYLKELLF